MASITYDEVFSRFFTKVEAYDLIDLTSETLSEFMCNWLRSALNYPHIHRLFSSVVADDNEKTVTFSMNYVTDETSDIEFMTELLAIGMVYSWVQPKVASITGIAQMFGTGDEKYYSQAQHLSELRGLRDDAEKRIRDMTSSRGFFKNLYLDGKSASATMRKKS